MRNSLGERKINIDGRETERGGERERDSLCERERKN